MFGYSRFLKVSLFHNITNNYKYLFIYFNNFSCVACSKFVRNEFEKNREKFLIGAMNDPYYLEKLCEIEKLINDVKVDDRMINLESDDF